jgi:integral membrane sensor domain MASE1
MFARSLALRSASLTALICSGYYAAGAIGIALRFEPGGISGVWLPQGVLLAALLLNPVRRWGWIAAVLLPIHLYLARWFHGSGAIWIILIQYGGNLLQAALSAAVLRRAFGSPLRLHTLSRMGAFIATAFVLSGLVSLLVVWLFVATASSCSPS